MAIYVHSVIFLVFAILFVDNASCSNSGTPGMDTPGMPSSENERLKRKVSELDTASVGALEYMEDLREKYSDSEGRPVLEHDDDPTSVWCIMDRDMLRKAYRPRPEPPARCTVQNRFIFNWGSILEDQQDKELPVQKALLRAYLKPIQRLLKKDPTPVDIDIRVGLLGEKQTMEAGSERIDVSSSTSWLELDVTRGVQPLWPPQTQNHYLEFTINLSVNCKDTKKVPAIFIDPTEIELSNPRRRERHERFQPFFLVFFNDAEVREIVINETKPITDPMENSDDLSHSNTGAREKRTASSCTVGDFPVTFSELHLNYILVPLMYNARQCSGSCSHSVLTNDHQLGTNHANIMAGAYDMFHGQTDSFRQTPQAPCCVPIRYSSVTLIVLIGDALDFKVYPAMKVEECGCR